jgi:hypothetical protein
MLSGIFRWGFNVASGLLPLMPRPDGAQHLERCLPTLSQRTVIALITQGTALYIHRAARYRRIFLRFAQPRHHMTVVILALASMMVIVDMPTFWTVVEEFPFLALPVWLYGSRASWTLMRRRSSRS